MSVVKEKQLLRSSFYIFKLCVLCSVWKVETTLNFPMAEDIEMEDENFLEIILSNLFRKETNGDAIEFYLRRARLSRQNNVEHDDKFNKLKEQIEKCGGHLEKEPSDCHSIELVFSEEITNIEEIDSDLFKAEYIEECIRCGDLLDLEEFRLGKSPYGSININMIMKGYITWDSVSRNSPQRGRKLPDFGLPLQKSPETFKSNIREKKSRRVEYSVKEDLAILKFLLANNLCDKVGGNATWKLVHRTFPNHSYQSLHNRFRRFILPNLNKYEGLTNSERSLFNRVSSGENSHVSSPEKNIETENVGFSSCSVSQKSLSTTENVTSEEEQEALNIGLSLAKGKIVVNQQNEIVRNDALRGEKQMSSSKEGKNLHLRKNEDIDKDENTPMTPNFLEMILNNLFRKESNGDPIEFYVRRTRFCHHKNNVELEGKCSKLKERIEKCGGNFGETPHSCHSIELVFPETIDDINEIDSDVFRAEYVEDCIKCGELLNLEDFRLGKSPYDGSDINNIMKGHDSWDSVSRTTPLKGQKQPDFGSSPEKVQSCSSGKKSPVEFSLEEDLAVLKCLLYNNLYDKVKRKTTWKIVNREFPKYSLQSLQIRFHQFILPNLYNYHGLTKSERNLFSGSLKDTSCAPSPERNSVSQNESSTADEISDSESTNVVSMPAAKRKASSSTPRIMVEESSLSSSDDLKTVKSSMMRKNYKKRTENFSLEMDQSILQYITLHKRYSEISGTKLWMDIQGSLFKNTGQDWKSLKRRFQDVILKDLESKEYALDKEVIRRFHSNHSSSSSDLDCDFDEAASYGKTQKSAPRLYSCEEDNLIVSYIVKNKRYEEVRGKTLWVDIQDKVLHEHNRSWESAKNRFLRTIFKNLHKFRLSADIIEKFERGAVAERHLGGCLNKKRARSNASRKKTNTIEGESEEEAPPKHPALAMKKIPTPSKKQKRQLFRQPIIPLPIVFSPQPIPLSKQVGSSTNQMKPCEKKEDSGTDAEIGKSNEAVSNLEMSPKKPMTEAVATLVTTSSACETNDLSNVCPLPKPLRSAPSVRCSVVLKKLTQEDLEKFGCKVIITQENSSSTHAEPSPNLPVTLSPKNPSTASRFTVEISPCLLAARLSAARLVIPPISSASHETVRLPASSSQESTRNNKQQSKRFKDDVNEESSPETSTRISPQGSPLSTGSSTTIENCDVYDEINSEADLVTETDSPVLKIAHNLPFQTKIPNHSFARLMKDDQSSDGYHTPEG